MYEGAYTWTIFGVSNKQLASQKQQNEHVLHVINALWLCYIKTKRQCIIVYYFIIESAFYDVPRAVYHIKFLNTNWFRKEA